MRPGTAPLIAVNAGSHPYSPTHQYCCRSRQATPLNYVGRAPQRSAIDFLIVSMSQRRLQEFSEQSGKRVRSPRSSPNAARLPFRNTAILGPLQTLSNHRKRPLTCGNIVAKVLGLVCARRLSHLVVARGILSPSQTGFSPLKGCEDHVFSLLELIKSNWRVGRPLHALFVDLKSAYDMVNPQALWAVFGHMGVPDNFIQVLHD